jgi:hypothetical protein
VASRNRGLLVSRSGPTMLARIAIMKALDRHVEREFNPERSSAALHFPTQRSAVLFQQGPGAF